MIEFPEPLTSRAEPFARLPDGLRRRGVRSAWGDANRQGASLDCFLEGPAFDRDGRLYCVDVPYGRIFRVDEAGNFEVAAEYDGWPYAVKIHKDGRIFIADYRLGILLLDPASGRVETLLDRHLPYSLKGANDLYFSRTGALYFTDYGQTDLHDPTGRVFRLEDGIVSCLTASVPGPNGLALSPDERILYVAATRSNAIWRAVLREDGSLMKVSVFAHLNGGVGPDGMTVDADGNLFVAHAGRGIVWGFSPHGELIHRILSCGGYEVTNLAFGGPQNRTLFITDADGLIQRITLPTPGHLLYSHQ